MIRISFLLPDDFPEIEDLRVGFSSNEPLNLKDWQLVGRNPMNTFWYARMAHSSEVVELPVDNTTLRVRYAGLIPKEVQLWKDPEEEQEVVVPIEMKRDFLFYEDKVRPRYKKA